MSLMNVVRIAKLLALLAFVLPWAAISCSVPGQGTIDLATASGIDLIQGRMTTNPDADKQMSRQMGGLAGGALDGQGGLGAAPNSGGAQAIPDLGMNFIGVGAAAVILVGLLLSFVGTARSAARNVMVTSLLGLALCFGTIWMWREQVKGKSNEGGGMNASSEFGGGMGGNMIDSMLQERFGYWIAISALIVAAGAGGLAMAGGAGAVKPDPAPPAV